MLWRSPGFAVAALVCLGLGIGLNATIFSLFDALVLHPYGFDTERLVSVTPVFRTRQPLPFLSGPEYDAIRTRAKSFESVSAYDMANWNLTGTGPPERLVVAYISPYLFETYGVAPVLGRGFLPEDRDTRTVIVSHRLWQNRFGADPKLPGGTIRLNGAPWTVAGVLPPRFVLGWSGLGGANPLRSLCGRFRNDATKLPRAARGGAAAPWRFGRDRARGAGRHRRATRARSRFGNARVRGLEAASDFASPIRRPGDAKRAYGY
jgi:hypothetical protein